MSILSAYSESTGQTQLSKQRLEAINKAEVLAGNVPTNAQLPELELSAQNKIDWLTHPRTQKMFQELGEQIKQLEERAISIANSSLPTPDTRLMEHCLVRAKSLKEVIRIYSANSNI